MGLDETPRPHASRLGPTYQGWECEHCGLVPNDEVTEMPDVPSGIPIGAGATRTAGRWSSWFKIPRAWANEASTKMTALAHEVVRLREALAAIADTHTTPAAYRRMASDALHRGFVQPLVPGDSQDTR